MTAYHRPTTLAQALELLRTTEGAVPLAGGTELNGRPRLHAPPVVDLAALGLDRIEPGRDELRLGAMVRLQTLVTSPEVNALVGGLIARAAWLTAPYQVRTQATLGGTLLGEAAARADLACALLALRADLVIAPEAERRETVPLETFYKGGRLEHELLVEVVIPLPGPEARAALHRIGRTPADQPILAVAGVGTCQGETIERVRLAALGVESRPVRLRAVERTLRGTSTGDESFEAAVGTASEGLSFLSDFRGSAEYRAAMLPILVRRVLHDICRPTPNR